MDNVVIDLLNAKWNTFIKFRWVEQRICYMWRKCRESCNVLCNCLQNRFYRCFLLFCLYFCISLVCFTIRPSPPVRTQDFSTTPSYTTTDMTASWSSPFTSEAPISSTPWSNLNDTTDSSTYDDVNSTTEPMTSPITLPVTRPPTSPITSPSPTANPAKSSKPPLKDLYDDEEVACALKTVNWQKKTIFRHRFNIIFFLLNQYTTFQEKIRMVTEIGVLTGVALYLAAAAREAWFLGRKMFFENLVCQSFSQCNQTFGF